MKQKAQLKLEKIKFDYGRLKFAKNLLSNSIST
jgi:hypothetical protein